MREQMQMLRDHLDKQIDVNEELLTAQLKKNSRTVRSYRKHTGAINEIVKILNDRQRLLP